MTDYHAQMKLDEKKLLKWAENEIKIAKEIYVESGGERGFIDEVYDTAFHCLNKMHEIDSEGYTLHVTLGVISSLIDKLPLSRIGNISKTWKKLSDTHYCNERCDSLIKMIMDNGDILYTDTNRVEIIDVDHNHYEGNMMADNRFEPASYLIDELYPIEFPYHPELYKVFVDRSDTTDNTFMVRGIVTPSGEMITDHDGTYEVDYDKRRCFRVGEPRLKLKTVTILDIPLDDEQDKRSAINIRLLNDNYHPIMFPYNIESDDLCNDHFIEIYKSMISLSDITLVAGHENHHLIKRLIQFANTIGKEVIYDQDESECDDNDTSKECE